jgi:hypothetical protein
MATTIRYPQKWVPTEPKDCPGCGIRYKLDVEFVAGPSALRPYQHCDKAEGEYIPGRTLALWELHDGKWCLKENYT